MTLPACMGGWCLLRESCPQYRAQTGLDPVERFCEKGQDGTFDGYPVQILRPVGTWERRSVPQLLRAPSPFDALREIA